MDKHEIESLLARQREWFAEGKTRDITDRLNALAHLQSTLLAKEKAIAEALQADLGKSETESYICETGLVLSEIRWMRKHIRALCREKRVHTPLAQFASRSFVSPAPYGTVLIMSPWNYPILLTLEPLVDALSAGNTAVLKPSAYAPHTSALLEEIIRETFPPDYVTVIPGGREENQALLEMPFDKIFFTGSVSVGRLVMQSAARYLTPVTLELGGKSPCIVDASANIALAARRIVFGKFMNCGQTCVAPDYILCDRRILPALCDALQHEIIRQYGADPLSNPAYGKIINEKHFRRLTGLLAPDKTLLGGQTSPEACRIAPTVLTDVSWEDPVMQQEIFGPILPILSYDSLEDAIRQIEDHPHPLALYLFSEDRHVQKQVLRSCRFGGGCINDTLIHLATSEMGFGGVGESGMGAYHGKAGFEAFSHHRSIVDKKTFLDLPMRYQPYTPLHKRLLQRFV